MHDEYLYFKLQQFIMYHEQATIINAWIKATQTHDVDLKVCILSWEWDTRKYFNIYKPEIMFVDLCTWTLFVLMFQICSVLAASEGSHGGERRGGRVYEIWWEKQAFTFCWGMLDCVWDASESYVYLCVVSWFSEHRRSQKSLQRCRIHQWHHLWDAFHP